MLNFYQLPKIKYLQDNEDSEDEQVENGPCEEWFTITSIGGEILWVYKAQIEKAIIYIYNIEYGTIRAWVSGTYRIVNEVMVTGKMYEEENLDTLKEKAITELNYILKINFPPR